MGLCIQVYGWDIRKGTNPYQAKRFTSKLKMVDCFFSSWPRSFPSQIIRLLIPTCYGSLKIQLILVDTKLPFFFFKGEGNCLNVKFDESDWLQSGGFFYFDLRPSQTDCKRSFIKNEQQINFNKLSTVILFFYCMEGLFTLFLYNKNKTTRKTSYWVSTYIMKHISFYRRNMGNFAA